MAESNATVSWDQVSLGWRTTLLMILTKQVEVGWFHRGPDSLRPNTGPLCQWLTPITAGALDSLADCLLKDLILDNEVL